MKKKQKSKRSRVPHASLKKNYNSKIRQEYIDLDYIDKLDDTVKNCKLPNGKMVTQLEYMSIFMKEYNSGGVGKQSEAKKNAFHRTAQEVKDCTDRTNFRNRDQYGIAKATHGANGRIGLTELSDVDDETVISTNYTEDIMVELLDRSKNLAESSDDGDD